MTFSDRLGITQPKSVLQIDSMDDDLRNGLWEACSQFHIRQFRTYYDDDTRFQSVMNYIYVDFFKEPSDTVPRGYAGGVAVVRDWFFEAKWFDVYNFIEFLFQISESDFIEAVTKYLVRERSGFRVIDKQFVPITDPIEVSSVTEAGSVPLKFVGVREHIQSAVAHFSRKPEPDYRNCIKEAICAVESIAGILSGNPKATLGQALKVLNSTMPIHPALSKAMSTLYGYSSEEGGIRHGLLDASNIGEAEAKFMLVACSAFVNFCIQRSK